MEHLLILGRYFSLALVLSTIINSDAVTVKTRWGSLRGQTNEVLGKRVDAYLGIPYAEPPIDNLRFAPPKPWARAWKGKRNAKKFGNNCWQQADTALDHPGTSFWYTTNDLSEDCLFLNIWTPRSKETGAAVMVWIHGGSFNWGTANVQQYNGQILASTQNVVVVTINYRLGPFGFLTLDSPEIPGNMGLMDQTMALQWIQENIAVFGGDPNLVTIFGSSAGGASVGFHLLSPMSRDLFKRAILESGAPSSPPLAPVKNVASSILGFFVQGLVNNLGCAKDGGNVSDVANCLRKQSAYNISSDPFASRNHFIVVDGTFLDSDIYTIVEAGNFKHTDIMSGNCQKEGMVDMARIGPGFAMETEGALTYDQFQAAILQIVYGFYGVKDIVRTAAEFQYTDWTAKNDPYKLRDGVVDMYSDYILKCPNIEISNTYSVAGDNVYYYELRRRSSNSPWPEWMGAVHGDEIRYIFGHPLVQGSGSSEGDVALSRQMMTYWVNFAKYGNPNEPDSIGAWPRYSVMGREYIILDASNENMTLDQDTYPRTPYCEFWQEYIPELDKQPTTAKPPDESDSAFTDIIEIEDLQRATTERVVATQLPEQQKPKNMKKPYIPKNLPGTEPESDKPAIRPVCSAADVNNPPILTLCITWFLITSSIIV